MDPITHLAAGASIAALIAPRLQRRFALLLGGVVANAPDLDELIPHADAIADFTMHRGFTHSLFVVPLFALVWWAFCLWRWPEMRAFRWRWLLAFVAAVVSHPLLDACNVYGTQILWPLDRPTTMWGLLFIIDPLFSLPLLIGAIAAWRLNDKPRAHTWLAIGVMLSASYLTWSLVAKNTLEAGMHADLKARGLVDYKLLVEPMPFTTILWRIVVMRADGDFYEGFYSFAGPGRATTLDHHPGFRYLLAEVGEHPGLRKLETFTHGFYAATTDGNRIVVNDIRMGAEPDYAFHFEIAERRDGRVVPLPAVKLPWPPMDWARYRSIWERAQRPQTGGDKAPGVDDTKPAATPAPAKL